MADMVMEAMVTTETMATIPKAIMVTRTMTLLKDK